MSELKFNSLFFALWPDQEVRSELTRVQQKVCGQNGRLHHPQDLHMTLVFLGRVTPEQLSCVRQVGDAVVAELFTLELERTGFWKRPRILWCGPKDTPQQLAQLVQNLQQGLCACGFQPEQRTFRPHVTLARKVKQADADCLDESLLWTPRSFVLAGSHSGSELPRYRILNQWELHP